VATKIGLLAAVFSLTLAGQALAQQNVTITDPVTGNKATVSGNALDVSVTGVVPPPTNPSTIYSAQQTVTTSAVALASQALSNGIVLTADPGNSAVIFVGPAGVTTSTGYKLQPGNSVSYGVTNASAIYIISAASTTDKISETGN
jgi:hypothetical protein